MVELPTAKQLRQLPLRAIVAYTVRCAQRVQPLYVLRPDASDEGECLTAVQSAISVATEFAVGIEITKARAVKAEEAAIEAVVVASQYPDSENVSPYAANAAYAAVHTTIAALDFLKNPQHKAEAAKAVVLAAVTAADAAAAADKTVIRAAEFDWQMLHRMQLGRFPKAGEPVDPAPKGFLGPLYRDWQREAKSAKPSTASLPKVDQLQSELAELRVECDRLLSGREQLQRELSSRETALTEVREELRKARETFKRDLQISHEKFTKLQGELTSAHEDGRDVWSRRSITPPHVSRHGHLGHWLETVHERAAAGE